MQRRTFLAATALLSTARSLFASSATKKPFLGICAFSCHQHWQAAGANQPEARFHDPLSFYRYCKQLGGEGVQTGLRGANESVAKQIRAQVERDGCYYEGDVKLPKQASEVEAFAAEVKLAREAGADVVRAVLMGGRRYEVFKTLAEFKQFHAGARRSLELAEPVVRQQRMKLAIENHKDLTADEQMTLLRQLGSEWIGVLVDTGNNLALLEDPYLVIETLAPLAWSVHLKDMAVQSAADGFLLSEVSLGTGMLDLPRIVAMLQKANPTIRFNLEMATRDPLKIPCLTDGFWATFPERRVSVLEPALKQVQAHPLEHPVPQVAGKSVAEKLAAEETNNRSSLAWMQQQIGS